MNLDATLISVSLIATGVATCILLGNPQMDKRYPLSGMGAEKSLGPLTSVMQGDEKAYQKLDQLESEVADLKEQMDTLTQRMAETNPKVLHIETASSTRSAQEAVGFAEP
jgi:hypothetical protein